MPVNAHLTGTFGGLSIYETVIHTAGVLPLISIHFQPYLIPETYWIECLLARVEALIKGVGDEKIHFDFDNHGQHYAYVHVSGECE